MAAYRSVLGGAAVVLLLTGCTPSGPVSPTPTRSPGSPPATASPTPAPKAPRGDGLRQVWRFTTDTGAVGAFSVPSRRTPLIGRVEAERKRDQGKPVSYVVIDIDNTAGSSDVAVDSLSIRGQDGRVRDSVQVVRVIEGWKLPGGRDARAQLLELQQDLLRPVPRGAKGTAVVAYRKPISSIARSFIYLDDGLTVVEAHPV